MRPTTYKILGTADSYSDAAARLSAAGEGVIVERAGKQRQLVLQCPDGCGEVLSINLDRSVGPAWRLYHRRGAWSLYPSIDRPTGCQSHFILSNKRIIWCDWWDWYDEEDLEEQIEVVRPYLRQDHFTDFVQIAGAIDAIPWDVLVACRALVRRGIAEEGSGRDRGAFRLKNL